MVDQLNFDDLTLREMPVKIAGEAYILREASEGGCAQYRNANLKCVRFNDNGKPVAFDGTASTDALLVSLCLFKIKTDADGEKTGEARVPEQVIRSWPDRIVKALAKQAKEISELNLEESLEDLQKQRDELDKRIEELQKESLKNEPSDTTNSSE